MFTGIVEGMAKVVSIVPHGAAHRLGLDMGALASDVKIGDSVAVDGACLTAVSVHVGKVEFDVITETVERTAFATLRVGGRVNVERPMRADARFHGHIVSGHVDGTGRIKVKRREEGQTWITIEAPPRLTALMIEKGSIAIDGVSLTLTEVEDTYFSVALIPHTLKITSLGLKSVGDLVNLEVDQLGKWVLRLMTAYLPEHARPADDAPKILQPGDVLREGLRRAGFGE